MGIDKPMTPDPETAPDIAPDVTSETGEETTAVDSTPEIPMAEADAEASPLAEGMEPTGEEPAMEPQAMADDIAPVEDGELPPAPKKSNMRVIIMAAVFLLAVAVFAAVYFLDLLPVTGTDDTQVATNQPIAQPQPAPAPAPAPAPSTAPAPAPAPTPTPAPTPASGSSQTTPPPQPAAPAPPPDPLPRPGPPPVATPIQVGAPTPEPFNGGPMPPRIERLRMKYITPDKLAAALTDAKVDVSLDRGNTENEVLVTGYAAQLDKVRSVLRELDVPEPPQVVIASLPAINPTPTRPPQVIGDYPVVPIEPQPGRHAGWIYNNNNGQVVAIFEDRTGVAHTVKVGDTVDGLLVTSITPDTLTLRDARRGTEYRLKLQGLDTYQARPSVNAVPATGAPATGMPAWGR